MATFSNPKLTGNGQIVICDESPGGFQKIPDGTPQSEWDRWPRESRLFAESGLTPEPAPDPAPPSVEEQLAKTDKDMARVAEDWIAAIAATNPAALQWIKDNRAAGLAKVNARRTLRNEPPL